ncbi:MAG: hypothetical protein H7Z17_15205 [Fuerstia sp.]|nr:hypothetical protein [Fuerstiella sp.]
MLIRTLTALVVVLVIGSGLFAQQNDAQVKVGDAIVIHMTGDLAKQYAKCSGYGRGKELPAGLEIQAIATIEQILDDGRIRIEQSFEMKRDGKQDCLVTLTATVDSTTITTDVTPKGTSVLASPATHKNDAEPTLTSEDMKMLRVALSGLQGVKLRTWTLTEEVGD